MSKTPQFILGIDWETSGSEFGGDSSEKYQGIALGAIIVKFENYEIVDEFLTYIKFDPKKYNWSAKAESIHGLSREDLNEIGISQEEAAIDFVVFIMKYFGPNPTIMIFGHNADFDIAFTKQLLEPFGLMFNLHHVNLDTASIGLSTSGVYSSEILFTDLGLPKRKEHNPLEDIKYTLEILKNVREVYEAGLLLLSCTPDKEEY